MPYYFEFVRNSERVELKKIMQELNQRNEYGYDFVVITGIAILRNYDKITEKNIDKFCDNVHEGKYKNLLKKYLIEKYKFDCKWRGS